MQRVCQSFNVYIAFHSVTETNQKRIIDDPNHLSSECCNSKGDSSS